jgi:hypothetical protein
VLPLLVITFKDLHNLSVKIDILPGTLHFSSLYKLRCLIAKSWFSRLHFAPVRCSIVLNFSTSIWILPRAQTIAYKVSSRDLITFPPKKGTMAPDLNSVPPSPRNAALSQQTSDSRRPSQPPSRRASQIYPMNPPPLPLASPGGTIPTGTQQGHIPFPPLSPSMSEAGVPIRHPRPMTPAEMHSELEKEQEAIVCILCPIP